MKFKQAAQRKHFKIRFKPNIYRVLIIPIILAALFFIISSRLSDSEEKKFVSMTDGWFREDLSENGLNLHYTIENPDIFSITSYSLSLGRCQSEFDSDAAILLENRLAGLDNIDYSKLSSSSQFTYNLLKDYFSNSFEGLDYYLYDEPLRPVTGILNELPILFAEFDFSSLEDIEDYMQLLNDTDDLIDSVLELENVKYKNNLFMSDYCADETISSCKDFISEKENYLITTFNEKIEDCEFITDSEKKDFEESNKKTVTDIVIPSYENVADTISSLKKEKPATSDTVNNLSKKDYYKYLVKVTTGSSRSIEELSDLINKYLVQNVYQVQNYSDKVNNSADISAMPSYTLDNSEAILNTLSKKISSDFPTVPNKSFTVKYVPESLGEYLSPAFYLIPTIDSHSKEIIYINPSSDYDSLTLFTTLAHEGYPGHMYQNLYFTSTNPSNIRYILNYPGYQEGWATYVEMYSYYICGLDQSLASIYQNNRAALLAIYSQSDIGINYYDWSLKDFEKYINNYGITDKNTIEYVYNFISCEPAYYLKYYIGYVEILELKERAKELWGENYSDKQFHIEILKNGPCPFSFLLSY